MFCCFPEETITDPVGAGGGKGHAVVEKAALVAMTLCLVAELPGGLQVLLDASITLILCLTGAHCLFRRP